MAIFKSTQKMIKHKIYLIFLMFACIHVFSQTNDDTSTFVPMYRHGVIYTIETTIGTKHTGFIVSETKDYVVIENRRTFEKTEINKNQIIQTNKSKTKQGHYEQKDILGDNNHASQYMVAGSAFLFKEGNTYSTNHYFLFQQADYALNSNWALTFNSFVFYPLGIGIKYSVKINDGNYFGFSTGVLGNLFRSKTSGPAFWAYHAQLRFTHGTDNKNFSVSAGVLSINATILDPSASFSLVSIPFVSGAYANRFSEKFVFNAEAWLFPISMVALAGAGFKYLSTDRIAWTFGCYTNVVSDHNTLKLDLKSIPIPYLGFSRRFK